MRVGDSLIAAGSGRAYVVEDLLGSGTFGQVVRRRPCPGAGAAPAAEEEEQAPPPAVRSRPPLIRPRVGE